MGKYVKKGYGNNKPPVEYQFKPGHAANKAGRPKGSKSHSAILKTLLNAPIAVLVNGKRARKTKWQVMVEQQINAAVGADLKAFQAVVQLMQHYSLIAPAAPSDTSPDLTREDQAVIALLQERFAASNSDWRPSNA